MFRLAFLPFCPRGQVYICQLTFIKAKPILRFEFAGSHIERSEARIEQSAWRKAIREEKQQDFPFSHPKTSLEPI